MKSVLVVGDTVPRAPDLAADLAAAGVHLLGASAHRNLVHDVIRLNPDLVVGHELRMDETLFEAFRQLAATAPRPVVMFTSDHDAASIERALQCGIHAYVVNGYGQNRLRSVLHLAEARFAVEHARRAELDELSQRFDERKLVDRAKGILMRARQVSEEEAFRVLRTASMHSSRRVGQVSQQVINAAHYAEAVNRAGKLRMLSQRLVKLCALRLLQPTAAAADAGSIDESIAQLDAHIAELGKTLSKATFGDLLEAVEAAWPPLRRLVNDPTPASPGDRLVELDRLAEQLLAQADQLTRNLETAGLVTTLHVINVSGRQRMLSQRCAKLALLGLLLTGEPARCARDEFAASALAFEQSMDYLRAIPLTTRSIRDSLDAAGREWAAMTQASTQVRAAAGLRALGDSSEALLGLFEQLTDHYERSMQVLMG